MAEDNRPHTPDHPPWCGRRHEPDAPCPPEPIDLAEAELRERTRRRQAFLDSLRGKPPVR